jgi:hypothetical protein
MPLLPVGAYHDDDHDAQMQRLHGVILRTAAQLAQCRQLIRQAHAIETVAWQHLMRESTPARDVGETDKLGKLSEKGDEDMTLAGVVVRGLWKGSGRS